MLKPEVPDFAKHRAAIGVAVRIPTSGKGVHLIAGVAGETVKLKQEEPHQCCTVVMLHPRRERAWRSPKASPGDEINGSQIRVTGGEHCRKARRFFFATAAFARFFEMPVAANHLQCPFAVNFLFEPPQGLVYRLAFFKLNFSQNYSLPLQ